LINSSEAILYRRPLNYFLKQYLTYHQQLQSIIPKKDTVTVNNTKEDTITVDYIEEDTITVNHYTKQGHRRLKGSKNKQYLTTLKFLSAKEKGDLELLLKL
jgi:hypothetical protein